MCSTLINIELKIIIQNYIYLSMNYSKQVDDPNASGMGMEEKESVLSEGTIQSSAISQERNQKINDQFQKKKLEFYKMYNKNPSSQ